MIPADATVYLAGPMTNVLDHNYPAFDRHAALLKGGGRKVINPADHDRKAGIVIGTPEGDEAAFRWDFEQIITKADGVAVIAGWERSRGARAEVELARLIGKFVVHADNLTELSSMEIKLARQCSLESDYLGLTAALTGPVPA